MPTLAARRARPLRHSLLTLMALAGGVLAVQPAQAQGNWNAMPVTGLYVGAGAGAKSLNSQCANADPLVPKVCLADNATIRSSVGGSILWNSPLGPLRLDVAKALSKENFDKEQLIRFGASTKF